MAGSYFVTQHVTVDKGGDTFRCVATACGPWSDPNSCCPQGRKGNCGNSSSEVAAEEISPTRVDARIVALGLRGTDSPSSQTVIVRNFVDGDFFTVQAVAPLFEEYGSRESRCAPRIAIDTSSRPKKLPNSAPATIKSMAALCRSLQSTVGRFDVEQNPACPPSR